MRRISDIELHEMKKAFEHICDILGIPKDAITFKQESEEGDRYGIFCDKKYFDRFSDYMYSLEGWEEKKPGTWKIDIDHSRGWDWRRFYCSECGGWQTYGAPEFCPKCGARMVKGVEK